MSRVSLRDVPRLCRSGRLEPAALVVSAAEHIGLRNSELNAIVSERVADARAEALTADTRAAVRRLPGVPFTAKDLLATDDLATTCGSWAFDGKVARDDATAVGRLRAAGAILMGKTNCPEFGLGVDTNNDRFGRTRNPLGEWTPGGSSGGEAAAVGAGMSLIGLGTDYGGSVRWPAQCTGLVGLRPTVGRVPKTGEQPAEVIDEPARVPDSFQYLTQVIGPLARTVDDVAVALDVLAGSDGIDPLAVDVDLPDYRQLRVRDIDVRWATDVGGVSVHPDVAAAVRCAVSVLRARGASVEDGVPGEVHLASRLYDTLRAADPMAGISRHCEAAPDRVGAAVTSMLAARIRPSATERAELGRERAELTARLRRWLAGERVLVLPVSVDIPRDLGGTVDDFALLTPSRAVSLFGLPALSVPVARAHTGAPLSVQVVAPAFREDVALAIGAALTAVDTTA